MGRPGPLPQLAVWGALVVVGGCLGPGTLNENMCFADPEELIAETCSTCHRSDLSGSARGGATAGVDFDTAADVQRHAVAIRNAAMVRRSMPPFRPLAECNALLLEDYLSQLEEGECLPSCSGRACGDDACGGSCGTCDEGLSCRESTGRCVTGPCTPDCTGARCGNDGCGGSCGTCAEGTACDASRTCICVPTCPEGAQCGPDGCGGACGAGCEGGLICNTRTHECAQTCSPDCTDRICGDDGCGGSCGDCQPGATCRLDGTCACAPDCGANECGDDGCGGSCGTCGNVRTCVAGQCEWDDIAFGQVYAIFQTAGCGGQGCHSGFQPKASLNLATEQTAYDELVGVLSTQCSNRRLVAPGDVDASYLVNKLTGLGMCSGSAMPKSSSLLPQSQLDTIRAWIGSGAGR